MSKNLRLIACPLSTANILIQMKWSKKSEQVLLPFLICREELLYCCAYLQEKFLVNAHMDQEYILSRT